MFLSSKFCEKDLYTVIYRNCEPTNVICDKIKGQNEPYLLIMGSVQEPKQAFLIVDQEILCKNNVTEVVTD